MTSLWLLTAAFLAATLFPASDAKAQKIPSAIAEWHLEVPATYEFSLLASSTTPGIEPISSTLSAFSDLLRARDANYVMTASIGLIGSDPTELRGLFVENGYVRSRMDKKVRATIGILCISQTGRPVIQSVAEFERGAKKCSGAVQGILLPRVGEYAGEEIDKEPRVVLCDREYTFSISFHLSASLRDLTLGAWQRNCDRTLVLASGPQFGVIADAGHHVSIGETFAPIPAVLLVKRKDGKRP